MQRHFKQTATLWLSLGTLILLIFIGIEIKPHYPLLYWLLFLVFLCLLSWNFAKLLDYLHMHRYFRT